MSAQITVDITVSSGQSTDTYFCRLSSDSVEELQDQFLKRFDNYIGTKQAERDRAYVKRITKASPSIDEWTQRINQETHWRIGVRTFALV